MRGTMERLIFAIPIDRERGLNTMTLPLVVMGETSVLRHVGTELIVVAIQLHRCRHHLDSGNHALACESQVR